MNIVGHQMPDTTPNLLDHRLWPIHRDLIGPRAAANTERLQQLVR